MRSYRVFSVAGNGDGWRVVFYVDGEEVGSGQFQTPLQADEAGVDFMFGGS